VIPSFDHTNKKITYEVRMGKGDIPEAGKTSRGAKFKCIMCGEATTPDYIKDEAVQGRMGAQLMAVVAEGEHGRLYISPDEEHQAIAKVDKPDEYPTQELANDPRNLWCPAYGLDTFDKLFTNRQLTALTTFSELVGEAQKKVVEDGGSEEYGQAIGVYLSFIISKMADRGSTICSWDSSRDGLRNTFGRQAIPMVWDYAEGNPFSNSSGCFDNMVEWIYKCILEFPASGSGFTQQLASQYIPDEENVMVSTDPPYYDNISYANLSDFFYVWLRRALKNMFPELFSTMLTPKDGELIATPYRFDGSCERAKD